MPTTMDVYSNAKLEPVEFPQDARIDAARLGASLTLAAGTVLGKKTSDSKLYAYNNSNSDGTEVAVAILVYATATDASGNHYFGGVSTASPVNLPHNDCSVYVAGAFDTSELTGWDTAAATDFHARALPSGYVRIP